MIRSLSRGGLSRWRAVSRRATVLIQLLLAGLAAARDASRFRVRQMPPQYTCRLRLEPYEIPGPLWRRHRYWLLSPGPLACGRPIVLNERTGQAYRWVFQGNRRGRGWLGVSTRWAVLHPGWQHDPWALLCACITTA